MNYEAAVIDFLAEKENLSLALEIAERIERVKDKLHKEFWFAVHRDLENRLRRYRKTWRLHTLDGELFDIKSESFIPLPATVCGGHPIFPPLAMLPAGKQRQLNAQRV